MATDAGQGPHDENNQCAERLRWIEAARRHWMDFHREIAESRKLAAGTLTDREGEKQRVNLGMSTLQALMPHIYARDPEIAGTPKDSVAPEILPMVRQFGQVSASLINHMYDEVGLKAYAKRALRSALSAKIGWTKQIWQADYRTDPIMAQRIEDTQNDIAIIERSLRELDDESASAEELQIRRAELQQTLEASEKTREVVVAQGLSLSNVRPEHLILDPTIDTIEDWRRSRRIVELMPMARDEAEEMCGTKLEEATPRGYRASTMMDASGKAGSDVALDPMVLLFEEWDRKTRTVYTYADGRKDWAREPYTPQYVSEIFYPWRPLFFHLADGDQMPMSLLELLDPLVDEYNELRKQQRGHREASIPHWIASSENPEENIRRHTDAAIGEVVIIDSQGKPLNQMIQRAEPPPWNPAIYDPTAVRQDINELSGLQDAARGAIQQAKTATEAEILQQGLAGRADTARDVTEDWLSALALDGLQIAAQAVSQPQIAEIVGPERAQVWPLILSTRRNLYESTTLAVRAGSTGKPNAVREQQAWREMLPLITQSQARIRELVAMGLSPEPEIEVLRETLRRMGEHIEIEPYIPPEALAFIEAQRAPAAAPVAGAPVEEPAAAPNLTLVS